MILLIFGDNLFVQNLYPIARGAIYINSMKTNVLVADDDMAVHKLLCDVLEISLKGVRIERAMSLQSFWAKLPAPPEQQPWQLVFLSADYIREEPDGFIDRVAAVSPDVVGRVIAVGAATDTETSGGDLGGLPFLVRPFSLDNFDALVKRLLVPIGKSPP